MVSIVSPPLREVVNAWRRRGIRLLFRPGQAGEFKALASLEELLLRLRLLTEAPQADEAAGGLVVEQVAAFVSRQPLAVQAVLALAADDGGFALEQGDADETTDEPLTAQHELEEVLVESAEPQSIINDVGILLRDQRLEALGLLAQDQR